MFEGIVAVEGITMLVAELEVTEAVVSASSKLDQVEEVVREAQTR